MNQYEWETCDCSKDFERFGEIEMCGCGEKHCRFYRDKVIHWFDKHWRLECAFGHAINLLKNGLVKRVKVPNSPLV